MAETKSTRINRINSSERFNELKPIDWDVICYEHFFYTK